MLLHVSGRVLGLDRDEKSQIVTKNSLDFVDFTFIFSLQWFSVGNFKPRPTIFEVFWAVGTSQRGFSCMHGS